MSRAALNPLGRLQIAIASTCDLYSAGRPWGFPVYPEWSGRDVLAHLVAWHESLLRLFRPESTAKSRTYVRSLQ